MCPTTPQGAECYQPPCRTAIRLWMMTSTRSPARLARTVTIARAGRRPVVHLSGPPGQNLRSAACRSLRRNGEGSRRTATPGRRPAAPPRTGSCRAAGQAPPASTSPLPEHGPVPRCARILLPEIEMLHGASLQVLQLRHAVTCLIRSRTGASARRAAAAIRLLVLTGRQHNKLLGLACGK